MVSTPDFASNNWNWRNGLTSLSGLFSCHD